MEKLFGMLAVLSGDILLLRYLSTQTRNKIACLEEFLLFLRQLTCEVTEWKHPLEEAVLGQETSGEFIRLFCLGFTRNQKNHTVREALFLSLDDLALPNKEAKHLLENYLRILGTLPKDATMEAYHATRTRLEEILLEEKEAFQSRQKLTAGSIYAISALCVILII